MKIFLSEVRSNPNTQTCKGYISKDIISRIYIHFAGYRYDIISYFHVGYIWDIISKNRLVQHILSLIYILFSLSTYILFWEGYTSLWRDIPLWGGI